MIPKKALFTALICFTIFGALIGFPLAHLTGSLFSGIILGIASTFLFVTLITLPFLILDFIAFNKNNETSIELQKTIDSLVETQIVPVQCPCGKGLFEAPIFVNRENLFTCPVCTSKFRVEVTHESVLLTEPVNMIKAFESLKTKELPYHEV